MGLTRCNYSKFASGRQVKFDDLTGETLDATYPVQFYDDFFGEAYNTTLWGTTETDVNTAPALSDDVTNGAIALILDSDDITQISALHWGDNLGLDIAQGLIFEARLTFTTLPTSGGGEDVQAVWGLASAHNATIDTVSINAWFKLESAAQTALLWEVDDNVTNDDDNATSPATTLTASTYNIYRIDCTDATAPKFYVDDVLVGTGSMALVAGTEKVQPYFRVSKVKSAANTGTGTMLIDYVRVYQNRS